MSAWLIAVAGAGFGVGVLLIASAWIAPPHRGRTPHVDVQSLTIRIAACVVGGMLAFVVTGWVVATAAGGVGCWFAAHAWLRRGVSRRHEQARIEALATWCEQLRDLLSADHGVLGTISASVATCPAAMRDEVSRLATRLELQEPHRAISQFADEVDDPSGDLVANTLLEAMSRSGRTADLLSELAELTRDRAAMRLRVGAERAGHRAEARFVAGFTVAVVVGVVIFGRGTSFLEAYDSAEGELMLMMVVGLFVTGGVWMHRLTRFERPARVISVPRQGVQR